MLDYDFTDAVEEDDFRSAKRVRWLRGDYDTPVYKTHDEVMPKLPAIPSGYFEGADWNGTQVAVLRCSCKSVSFQVGELRGDKHKIAIRCLHCGEVSWLYK